MGKRARALAAALLCLLAAAPAAGLDLPWAAAGLTERQAAAHLLDRLTYGPRPGEVDRLLARGLDVWVEEQLAASLPEPELASRLAGLDALDLPVGEYPRRYPPLGLVLREAMEAGALPAGVDVARLEDDPGGRDLRRRLRAFARARGWRPQPELVRTLQAQKLLRAVYAENQLAEVLVDFWFNHFNVAASDEVARPYLLAYERDAIRPHVLGEFRTLLGATARHPAMLFYLDTARGLNENYARELLELHTMGVEGGYSEGDVVAVARAFTGWRALPPGVDPETAEARMGRARGGAVGFVFSPGFAFRADAHDAAPKEVLGRPLAAGRGIEDGEEVLDLLAAHPATADRLARKLATRFVADDPPAALAERLAASIRGSGGDLAAVMRVLLASPEFWSPEARAVKIKSPFELAVSALRALDAEVVQTRALAAWIRRLGQPLYAWQTPSGFPETGASWIGAGALLARMNFGLALAAGRIGGIGLDLGSPAGGREPESREAALELYLTRLLPEREVGETRALLAPLLAAPDLPERIGPPPRRRPRRAREAPPPTALQQVVGLIVGSPAFQTR